MDRQTDRITIASTCLALRAVAHKNYVKIKSI